MQPYPHFIVLVCTNNAPSHAFLGGDNKGMTTEVAWTPRHSGPHQGMLAYAPSVSSVPSHLHQPRFFLYDEL